MEAKIEILDVFLREIGEDKKISTLEDRLRLQKAIYLGQSFGVDLGYRYSWYVKGPYCAELTQDYYKLNDENKSSDKIFAPHIREKLAKVVDLLNSKYIPDGLQKPQWFELLASIHYLKNASKKDDNEVINIIKSQKPHLSNFISHGLDHLNKH